MKILNVDDMLEAARDSNLPNYEEHVMKLEAAATALGLNLARHLKIKMRNSARWNGKGFAGLCVAFEPIRKNQKCPEVIHDNDEDGDWEL